MTSIHRRFRSIDAQPDNGKLRLVGSTSDPVDMGGWREVLSHAAGACEYGAARTLLINHDPNQIAGTLSEITFDGNSMRCAADLLPGAKLASGVEVAEAVKAGALKGVSIGYTYSCSDTTWDKDQRTLTVNRWRLLEATLTPIPADPSASVRSVPFNLDSTPEPVTAPTKDARMSDQIDTTPAPDALAGARDAAVAEAKEIAVLARSHNLNADDFIGMPKADAQGAMLKALAERNATKPVTPVAPDVKVTMDAQDKFLRSAQAGMLSSIGMKPEAGVGSIHLPVSELIRRSAIAAGEHAENWSNPQLAEYGMRSIGYKRDAANKTSAMFSTLLGSTADKALVAGYAEYDSATWDQFCSVKEASTFNSHSHVGLSSGRLVQTAENLAFPELTQSEGSYSSQLAMWGATVSLTYQAIVNDELGEFLRSIRRAGATAARTVDREVYRVLLNATWTNDLTTSAGLGTAGKLDLVRGALKGKLSPAGEKMGHEPRILIVDCANRYNADLATGAIYKVDSMVAQGSTKVSGIKVVDSTWVSDTGLLGGVANTDYYLAANPAIIDTITVEFLAGMREPQILEFDPGAVAAQKWKIMLPFAATVATHTDSAGNARVSGIQKATA